MPSASDRPRRVPIREIVKFALIANLVFCLLVVVPLTLAALYQVQRTGWAGAGPRVWRVIGFSDLGIVACLLLAAATLPLLVARRRARIRAAPAPAETTEA